MFFNHIFNFKFKKMEKVVKFFKGTYAKYVSGKATYDSDGSIFCCTDKPVLAVGGQLIGISEETLSTCFEGVKDVTLDAATNTIKVSYFKSGKADVTLTIEKATSSMDGLMSKEDKAKLDGLDSTLQGLEVAIDGVLIVKNDQSQLTLAISQANKVLSKSSDGLMATLAFKDDSENQKIQLTGIGGVVIAEFDYAKFVVDGMLDDAEVDAQDNLVLKMNTAAGSKELKVSLAKYIDVYTPGAGISISEKTVSVNIKEGEKYLEATPDGLATKGLDEAVAAAIDAALVWHEA